jgi:cyclic peptide transporter
MNIFNVLAKQSRYFYLFIVSLGIVNSVVYISLLMFINNAVSQKAQPFLPQYDWLIFICLIVGSLICTKVFQTYMVRLTYELLFQYEVAILQKLRFATYQAFEKLGAQRVYTAIGDVRILSYIPEVLVAVINSTVIIFCALTYLFVASPAGGLAVLALMGSLLLIYLLRNKQIEKYLNKVRDLQNTYHQYLRDLLFGFKEIKMSIPRNEGIFNDFLRKNRLAGKQLGVKSAVRYLDNELLGTYSWYFALGIAMFVLPRLLNLSAGESIPFIVIILYLMSPLASLVKVLPYYTNVKIALERIEQIQQDVESQAEETFGLGSGTAIDQAFKQLVFKDVVFEYFDEKQHKTFRVGPLNLEIKKGEVVFITGGNGSGKSTFVNMLTGLYKPSSGQILFNNIPVTAENYPYYSNRISAIFTSNYLFSENYERFELNKDNAALKEMVELMQMNEVLRFDEERQHIDNGLSKGQQKRLAMIYAMLEGRDVLVLDEWAAEQDPAFRAFFYEELIPDFQKKGKTIIAVTHDDYYFNCADRMLKFDYGRIAEDTRIIRRKESLVNSH